MLLKLHRAGINGKTYELIKSIYHGSISRIKCKNLLTEPIMISQGVHRGNVLSPLLFNIFINDIGDEMCVTDVPVLHELQSKRPQVKTAPSQNGPHLVKTAP